MDLRKEQLDLCVWNYVNGKMFGGLRLAFLLKKCNFSYFDDEEKNSYYKLSLYSQVNDNFLPVFIYYVNVKIGIITAGNLKLNFVVFLTGVCSTRT